MDYLRSGIEAIAHAVLPAAVEKYYHHDENNALDLSAAESGERSFRLDALQMAHDQALARKVAELIDEASPASLHLIPFMLASRRRTLLVEEAEKARRVASKSEAAFRRRNAHKASLMISSLGWPFINYKKGLFYRYVDPTIIASEVEREYRINDTVGAFIARCNAGLVSNLIRWANHASAGALVRNATHALEENERARRLADREAMSLASHNGYIVSRMMKELGWPFYVQEVILAPETSLETLKHVGESVLEVAGPALGVVADQATNLGYLTLGAAVTALPVAARTVQSVAGTLMAGASALGLVTLGAAASAVEATKDALPTAKENAKAVIDAAIPIATENAKAVYNAAGNATAGAMHAISGWTEQAREHAAIVTAMVPHHVLTSADLEEKERRHRMKHATQGRTHASHEAALIKGLFASRPLVQYLYETERARRLADIEGQEIARNNAKKIAGLIREHNLPQTIAKESFLFETVPQIITHIPAPTMSHTVVVPGHHAHRARKSYIVTDAPAPFAHHDMVRIKAPLGHAHNAPVPPQPKIVDVAPLLIFAPIEIPAPVLVRASVPAPVPVQAPAPAPIVVKVAPIVEVIPVQNVPEPVYTKSTFLSGLPQARSAYNMAPRAVEPVQIAQPVQPVTVVETTTVETTTLIPAAAPIIAAPIPIVTPIVAAPVAQLPSADYSQFYDFSTPFDGMATSAAAPAIVRAPKHVPVVAAPVPFIAQPQTVYPAVTTRTFIEPVAQPHQQQGHVSVKERLRSLAHRHHAGNPSM